MFRQNIVIALMSIAILEAAAKKFQCLDKSIILESQRCDNIRHCPDGSDESLEECKVYDFTNGFRCANGIEIDVALKCNQKADCSDESDEHPVTCNKERNITYDDCGEDKVKCTSGECILRSELCDGTIHCVDGYDESLMLCLATCNYPNYQCTNGQCIGSAQVCDGTRDCVDGTDELLDHCGSQKSPICKEPLHKGLVFSTNTSFFTVNGTRFVYPNQQVELKCEDANAKLHGKKWDVCLHSGEWFNTNLTCKIRNADPYTNGTYGCPIDTYREHANNLIILECVNNICSKQILPPLNNVTVKFVCQNQYELYPTQIVNSVCKHKIWNSYSKYRNPRCVRKCKTDLLYCRDSMVSSHALTPNSVTVEIELGKKMDPGTRALMKCTQGFQPKDYPLHMICHDNGTWLANAEVENYCQIDCGIAKVDMAKNTPVVQSIKFPWTVAIYRWNNTYLEKPFKMQCTGVLIRVNLVLTAAHCVYDLDSKSLMKIEDIRLGPAEGKDIYVDANYGWDVNQIFMYDNYYSHNHDVAIIKFTMDKAKVPIIMCLPWHINGNMNLANRTRGHVSTWISVNDDHINAKTNFTFTSVYTRNHLNAAIATIELNTLSGGKVCQGDSGSAFVTHCNSEKTRYCLYGIISYGLGVADGCTNKFTIMNTNYEDYASFIDRTIQEVSNTCDQIAL